MFPQTKTVAGGFGDVGDFIVVAYPRPSKLKHMPANPFATAIAVGSAATAEKSISPGYGTEPHSSVNSYRPLRWRSKFAVPLRRLLQCRVKQVGE